MPGPVSDSYDPEFSTTSNALDVKEAMEKVREKIAVGLDELKNIVGVVHGKAGALKAITLSEKERRVLRFALNRAIDDI